MGFWEKLFSKKDGPVAEVKEVNLALDELKTQVNSSMKRVNDLGDQDYVEPVVEILARLKSTIKALMSRSLNNDYNKALLIGANNARKRVYDQLMPLLSFKEPTDLVGVNAFIKDVEKLLIKASEVSAQSSHAQVIFRDDMAKLGSCFDELNEGVNDLKQAVAERNDQLEVFNSLVKEIKAFEESVDKLESIKKEEFNLRKRISSYERDKAFFTSEITRIKNIETFDKLDKVESSIKDVKNRIIELEGKASTLVSKFSRVLRKAYRNDDFVQQFLVNPLEFIHKNEGEFNKRMNRVIDEINKGTIDLNDKEKKRYLKALSDDLINDYINEYNDLLRKQRVLAKNDFSLLRKAEAFERRLIDLRKQVNKDMKGLDEFKVAIDSQNREIEALKAKVEAMASECYQENVRLL